MPGMLTYDDVHNKLLIHEQQVQFLKRRNSGYLTHFAFVTTIVSSSESGFNSWADASNHGRGKNDMNNHGKNNRNNNGKEQCQQEHLLNNLQQ